MTSASLMMVGAKQRGQGETKRANKNTALDLIQSEGWTPSHVAWKVKYVLIILVGGCGGGGKRDKC